MESLSFHASLCMSCTCLVPLGLVYLCRAEETNTMAALIDALPCPNENVQVRYSAALLSYSSTSQL